MGNTNGGGNMLARRDRRRELAVVFYFVFGFVMIRIWILLVESHDILIESIGAVVTFLLILVLYIRYRMQRNQQLQEEERLRLQHPEVNPSDFALLQALFRTPQQGLSQDIINSLYSFKYSEDILRKMKAEDSTEPLTGSVATGGQSEHPPTNAVGDIENQPVVTSSVPSTCCSICLAEYVLDDDLLRLPCRHAYHKQCVCEWLQRHTQCPLCKQDVLGLLEQQLIAHHQLDRLRDMSGTGTGSGWVPADSEEIRSSENLPVVAYSYTALAIPTTPTTPAEPNTGNNPMLSSSSGDDT